MADQGFRDGQCVVCKKPLGHIAARLAALVAIERQRQQTEHRFDQLTAGEWCDLLEHQLNALRDLEGASPDEVDAPDIQARDRLVKVVAIAGLCGEFLERHLERSGRSAA